VAYDIIICDSPRYDSLIEEKLWKALGRTKNSPGAPALVQLVSTRVAHALEDEEVGKQLKEIVERVEDNPPADKDLVGWAEIHGLLSRILRTASPMFAKRNADSVKKIVDALTEVRPQTYFTVNVKP